MADQTIKIGNETIAAPRFFNAIRNSSDTAYQRAVPMANANNLEAVSQAIVGRQRVFSSFYGNSLKFFASLNSTPHYQDDLTRKLLHRVVQNGAEVELNFIGQMNEQIYSTSDSSTLLNVERPQMVSLYGRANRFSRYPLTISLQSARQIMQSSGTQSLIDAFMGSMRTKAEIDSRNYAKLIFKQCYDNGGMIIKEVGDVDKDTDTVKKFAQQLRKDYLNMRQPSNREPYNVFGAENPTEPDNLLTVFTTDIQALMDVQVFASAFNMEKTAFLGSQLPINDFLDSNVLALLFDKQLFQVFDILDYQTEGFNDPSNLMTHFYLHIWQAYTYFSVFNGVAYVRTVGDNFKGYLQLCTTELNKNIIDTHSQVDVGFKPIYPLQLDRWNNGDLKTIDSTHERLVRYSAKVDYGGFNNVGSSVGVLDQNNTEVKVLTPGDTSDLFTFDPENLPTFRIHQDSKKTANYKGTLTVTMHLMSHTTGATDNSKDTELASLDSVISLVSGDLMA